MSHAQLFPSHDNLADSCTINAISLSKPHAQDVNSYSYLARIWFMLLATLAVLLWKHGSGQSLGPCGLHLHRD